MQEPALRRPSAYRLTLLALLAGMAMSSGAAAAPGHGGGYRGGGGHYGGHYHGGGYHGRSHVGVGLSFGVPLFGPGYGPGWYDDPYWGGYRYARPVVVVAPPPVYIERAPVASPGSWYFCARPQGYYPYVRECATAWRTVPAQPPVLPPVLPSASPPAP